MIVCHFIVLDALPFQMLFTLWVNITLPFCMVVMDVTICFLGGNACSNQLEM